MKRIGIIMLAVTALIGCSESPEEIIPGIVDYNSLLVIDEANQVLNRVDLSNHTVSQVATLGTAANDIVITGNTAYIPQSTAHRLTAIDLSGGSAPRHLDYTDSPNPYEAAIYGDLLLVTLSATSQLCVIRRSDLSVRTNLSISGAAWLQPVAVTDGKFFVADTGGWANNYVGSDITVINANDYTVITNIALPENPQSLSVDDEGGLFIACTGTYDTNYQLSGGALLRMNLTDYSLTVLNSNLCLTVATFYEGRIYGIGGNNDGLYIMDTSGNVITNLISGNFYKSIAFDSDHAFVSQGFTSGSAHVRAVNTANYSVTVISNTGGGDLARY